MSRPIVLYAYNRPNYFEQVLRSLQAQTKETEVFLFNDGPRNSAEDKNNVTQSVGLFKKYFPNSTAFASDINLGVAFNQKRGREFIFDRAESAIFIEDDIVLNDYYIKQLNILMDKFESDPDIAMVSCFGEIHRHRKAFGYCNHLVENKNNINSIQEQDLNKNQFMQMEHLWAYGFFKRAYQKIYKDMEGYYNLLPEQYDKRPNDLIHQYCRNLGVNKVVSSQDSVLSGLLVKNGFIKVSTFTMNAKYIGKEGVHSNIKHYNRNWKKYPVYHNFIQDFHWDNDVKNSIKKFCQYQFLG